MGASLITMRLPIGVAVMLLTAACGVTADPAAPTPPPPGESPRTSDSNADAAGVWQAPWSSSQPTTSSASPSPSPTASRLDPSILLDEQDLEHFAIEFGPKTALAVGFVDGHQSLVVGGVESPYAWSTIKVVIAARVILDAGGVDGLRKPELADVEASVTRSDNQAAARLWDGLVDRSGSAEAASARLEEVLELGGDAQTRVSSVGRGWFSTYGQTLWTLDRQVRFLGSLAAGCVLSPADTDWLLARLGNVVPDQRWGLLRGRGAAGKGGWGPDPDGTYLVRQVAVLQTRGGDWYVAAAATRAGGPDFAASTRVLDDVLRWLEARVTEAPAIAGCSLAR